MGRNTTNQKDYANLVISDLRFSFYPEDGGDTFLRNVGNNLQVYRPEDHNRRLTKVGLYFILVFLTGFTSNHYLIFITYL
jgi:hypothetical protein